MTIKKICAINGSIFENLKGGISTSGLNPLEDNFMQVLSRIRRKFKDTVGEEQYKTYSIESFDGTYKITLDRELVSFNEHTKRLVE